MHALDILVLPSRRKAMWAEQFGRVLVEAMAAGKIIIGSSSGAIPEVIGNAGYVFRENDSNDLAVKIESVLRISETDRSQLLERANARAGYYSWSRFATDAFEAISYCHERFPTRV
jgi:glycosyltransferase involved in cell wall biosynthesis